MVNSVLLRWPGWRRPWLEKDGSLIEFWGILDGVKLLDFRRYGLTFPRSFGLNFGYVHEHGGYGVDPQKPIITLESKLEQLGRNAMTRAALADATAWVMPTEHQANSLPKEFRDQRLHIIHEGINTS